MNKIFMSRKECRRRFDSFSSLKDFAEGYTWYTLSGRFTRRQRRAHWLHKQKVRKVLPKLSRRQEKLAGFSLRDFHLGLWHGIALVRAEEVPS